MPGEETTETDSRSQRSRASRWGGQVLTRPRRSRSRAACPGRFLSDAPNPTTRPYESRHQARTVRDVIPDTNSIESLNYQLRKVTKNRGHFPNDAAAVKLLWLAICNIEDRRARDRAKERGRPATERRAAGRLVEGQITTNWKQALEQLTLVYPDRINPHL